MKVAILEKQVTIGSMKVPGVWELVSVMKEECVALKVLFNVETIYGKLDPPLVLPNKTIIISNKNVAFRVRIVPIEE